VAESATYSALQGGPELAAWRASRPVRVRAPETDVVRCDRDGSVLTITLDRPERHNAYSREMRDGLVAALRLALADPTLQVVLTGAGPSFSSGGDLDEFGTFPDPATAHRIRLTRSAAKLMARLGDRVEAHVHGACLGAGVELAAFAGRVVARPDARFGLPEVPLGLIPGAGGTASLPPRIGRQRTVLLALTAQPIDAETALRWGLVDEVAD
jgi:enoyl-CoA hydratase/carnithine racemase